MIENDILRDILCEEERVPSTNELAKLYAINPATAAKGINILDCWMADPKSRDIIGKGIKENRSQWFIQGHIGSTWKDL